MTALAKKLLDLAQGDHLCLFYERDPAEQMPAMVPFIQNGLASDEQCVYIADDSTVEQLREHLEHSGIDVSRQVARGRLKLWTRREWRQPGKLSSNKKAEQVRHFVRDALRARFKGIRFGVEMTWTLGPDIDAATLEHWEVTINTLFTPKVPGRIVCQYNQSRLAPGVLLAALHTHPLAILGEEVYPNPFYRAPLILGQPKSDGNGHARVTWMLSKMRELQTRVEERTAALTMAHHRLKVEIEERKRLESEIAQVAEHEQRRLGQELHDGLGQQLTGIVYQLSALKTELAKVSPRHAERARKLEGMVLYSVEQTRQLAKGFYPVALQRGGLLEALDELADITEQSFGVRCELQSNAGPEIRLVDQTAIQLFRIAQEAVHNAVKHANAHCIVIHVATGDGKLRLTVQDDGIGFPKHMDDSKGMGLRIMRHRAGMIRGTLECRISAAGGAVINCVVPASVPLN